MSQNIKDSIKQKISEDISPTKNLSGFHLKIVMGIAIIWTLFQLWYASPFPFWFNFGMFKGLPARAIHLGFALTLTFLIFPIARGKKISFLDKNIKDSYLEKFKIYCLVFNNKNSQAQLLLDLLREQKQSDKFFDDKINFLYGKNGAGKTNLLDAIYYLSYGKSIVNNLDTKPEVIFDTTKPSGDKLRILDTTRAKSNNIIPKISLENGVIETIQWYKENKDKTSERTYNAFKENN